MKLSSQIQIADNFVLQKPTTDYFEEYMQLYLRNINNCFFDYDFEQSGLKKAPFTKQKKYFYSRFDEDIQGWENDLRYTYLLLFQNHVIGVFRLYWWEEKPWIGRNDKGQFQKGPDKTWMIGIYTDQSENLKQILKENQVTKKCFLSLMNEALINQIDIVTFCTREDNLKALRFIKKFKIETSQGVFCKKNAWGDQKRWVYISLQTQDFLSKNNQT